MHPIVCQGRNGTVTFDGTNVIVRKRVMMSTRETVIPLSQLTGVARGNSGLMKYIRFTTAGMPGTRTSRQRLRLDGNAMLYSRRRSAEFDALAVHVRG